MSQNIADQRSINNSDVIYHYCSVDTFCKIIKSKTLWLSDSRYMNDLYETIWIDEKVEEVLIELEISDKFNQSDIEYLRQAYNEIKVKEHYLVCFSAHSNLLNQWQKYGDNETGVAIEFSRDIKISGILNKAYGVCMDKTIGIAQETTQRFGFENVDYDIKTTIKELIEDTLHDTSKIRQNTILLKELASRAKHFDFSEEKEVRLTYIPENPLSDDSDSFRDKSLKNISNKMYRSTGTISTPYFEFDFGDNIQFIQTIILGKKCLLSEEDLKKLLNDNGFNKVNIQREGSLITGR